MKNDLQMTKRQLQALETKEKIRKAAIELFRKNDFEKTTVAQICQEAGVAIGSFYNHFDSKEDVLLEGYKNFDRFVDEELSTKSYPSNIAAIRELVYYSVEPHKEYSPELLAQILRLQLCNTPSYRLGMDQEKRAYNVYLRKLVSQALARGELNPAYTVDDIAPMIWRLSRGLLFDWATGGAPYPRGEQILKDLDILLSAFINHG